MPASAIHDEDASSNDARSRGVSWNVSVCDSPGASVLVFANALSSMAGFGIDLPGADR